MKPVETIRYMPSGCKEDGFWTKEEHTEHLIQCLRGIFGDQRAYPEVEVPPPVGPTGTCRHNQVTWFRHSRLDKYVDPGHSAHRQIQQEGFRLEEIRDINSLLSGMLEQLDASSNKALADDYRHELIPWYEFSQALPQFKPNPNPTQTQQEK